MQQYILQFICHFCLYIKHIKQKKEQEKSVENRFHENDLILRNNIAKMTISRYLDDHYLTSYYSDDGKGEFGLASLMPTDEDALRAGCSLIN